MFWPDGLAGRELAAHVDGAALDRALQVAQLAEARRRLRHLADRVDVGHAPADEVAGVGQGVEGEAGSARHAFVQHRGGAAAGLGQGQGAAAVGGDQRRLGGRQRDVEVALRVHAVDAQRAGEPDRHLHGADEVLDVAGEDVAPGGGPGIDEHAARLRRRRRFARKQRPAAVERAVVEIGAARHVPDLAARLGRQARLQFVDGVASEQRLEEVEGATEVIRHGGILAARSRGAVGHE